MKIYKKIKAFTFTEMLISVSIVSILIVWVYILWSKFGIFDMDDSGIFATKQEIEFKNLLDSIYKDPWVSYISWTSNLSGTNYDYVSLSNTTWKYLIWVVDQTKTKVFSGSDIWPGYMFIKSYPSSATINLSSIDFSSDLDIFPKKMDKLDIMKFASTSWDSFRFEVSLSDWRNALFSWWWWVFFVSSNKTCSFDVNPWDDCFYK